mmetsp:Transcript_8016/g.20564  ORF Transcript_8016/g.20564 Transcript_8016/m.20564 type:complete len:265 (-) Transcript_8016:1372-2166(-)
MPTLLPERSSVGPNFSKACLSCDASWSHRRVCPLMGIKATVATFFLGCDFRRCLLLSTLADPSLWAITSSSFTAAAGYFVEMQWKAPRDMRTSSESLVQMAVVSYVPPDMDQIVPTASPRPAISSVWIFSVLWSSCASINLPLMVTYMDEAGSPCWKATSCAWSQTLFSPSEINSLIRGPIALAAVTSREMKACALVMRSFSSSTTPIATSSQSSSALTDCFRAVLLKYAADPMTQCGDTISAVHPFCIPAFDFSSSILPLSRM